MPVLFHAKVLLLHADHDVDGVLQGLRSAKPAFFGLVTDEENDAVSDRLAEIDDLARVRRGKRVPGIENVHRRSNGSEVRDRVAKRAALRRIDAFWIDVRDGANVPIHFFDLALADRNGGKVK